MTPAFSTIAIVMVALVLAITVVVLAHYRNRVKKPISIVPAVQQVSPSTPVMRRVLDIPGTQKCPTDWSALSAWGLVLKQVQDVAVVPGPCEASELPKGASDCLAMCFIQGHIRGIDVSKVVAGGGVPEGQSLYFVLSESFAGVPTLVALVG
jgi:hypothetical protein